MYSIAASGALITIANALVIAHLQLALTFGRKAGRPITPIRSRLCRSAVLRPGLYDSFVPLGAGPVQVMVGLGAPSQAYSEVMVSRLGPAVTSETGPTVEGL